MAFRIRARDLPAKPVEIAAPETVPEPVQKFVRGVADILFNEIQHEAGVLRNLIALKGKRPDYEFDVIYDESDPPRVKRIVAKARGN